VFRRATEEEEEEAEESVFRRKSYSKLTQEEGEE